MRANRYIAEATGMSRRQADEEIERGNVRINNEVAILGARVEEGDVVTRLGKVLSLMDHQYLLLNKPIGYVSSRKSQDEKPTIYTLFPEEYHHLKPAGRLDADSRGLLLLTNDGQFAHQMTHPSNVKKKVYHVWLDKELTEQDAKAIESGLLLEDGESSLGVEKKDGYVEVTMHEGRNRQIRRTFTAIEYEVTDLQRISFGEYSINGIAEGKWKIDEKRKA